MSVQFDDPTEAASYLSIAVPCKLQALQQLLFREYSVGDVTLTIQAANGFSLILEEIAEDIAKIGAILTPTASPTRRPGAQSVER